MASFDDGQRSPTIEQRRQQQTQRRNRRRRLRTEAQRLRVQMIYSDEPSLSRRLETIERELAT